MSISVVPVLPPGGVTVVNCSSYFSLLDQSCRMRQNCHKKVDYLIIFGDNTLESKICHTIYIHASIFACNKFLYFTMSRKLPTPTWSNVPPSQ